MLRLPPALSAVTLAFAASICVAQSTPRNQPAAPPVVAKPAGAGGLVAEGTQPIEVLGGLEFTAGPVVDADGQVFFTDVPTSTIFRLTNTALAGPPAGSRGYQAFVVNERNCRGLQFTADGRLVACQGVGALIEVDLATKALRPLAKELTGEGQPVALGRLHDLEVDRGGGIYFTDPALGLAEGPTRGVLYRAADGTVSRLDTTIAAPTGVRLSPDEKRLYVLSYKDPGIYAFDVLGPGKLSTPTKLADLVAKDGTTPRGRGDGLAIDTEGRLWCANPDSREIQIFGPDGVLLGRLEFPTSPSGCCFGGPDRSTLYVTGGRAVYAVPTAAKGHSIAGAARKN